MAALLHSPLTLFIVQAGVIIALSRIVGMAARKVGQPMVVAEVIAGLLLGPSVLGWASPAALATLFPSQSMPVLRLESEVGLVLFMFLIGLELDPRLLRGRGRASVVISTASIVTPLALGGVLGLYLYPRLAPAAVPFSSFVLFTAIAMSITAFPVLARILTERRLLRSKVGVLAIACAGVNDVTAWCLLAFAVSFVRASGIAEAARTAVLAAVYIGAMLFVFRPLLHRLAARVENPESLTQDRVAFTLILLIASSWATDLIGIHFVFGAFLFGAIVPKEGGFAHLLADKLEDLVVVFLLPLFFAYSGLRTQVGLLDTPHAWLMCALVLLVACVGKFGGSAIAARTVGLDWREASALGVLMNTRGLMELIILNIGLDLGVITPALFTMMVLVALVTTFLTTPLLEWVYPRKELAKELAEPEAPPAKPEFTVMICVAYERSGPSLLTVAEAIAGKHESRLYALRLVPPTDRGSAFFPASPERGMTEALEPMMERAEQLHLSVRPIAFISTQPAHDICDVAHVKLVDLVLLGWHKPLLSRTVLGGTVHEVMEEARTSVAVFIDRGLAEIRKVLVPYQGTDDDKAALRLARRLTQKPGVELTILHVVTPERAGLGAKEEMEQTFTEETGQHRASVRMKLVHHVTPSEAAVEEAGRGYDLVLVAAGEQWGLEPRLFGLLPEQIVRDCPTSLLIVRSRDPRAAPRRTSPPPARPRDPYPTLPAETGASSET